MDNDPTDPSTGGTDPAGSRSPDWFWSASDEAGARPLPPPERSGEGPDERLPPPPPYRTWVDDPRPERRPPHRRSAPAIVAIAALVAFVAALVTYVGVGLAGPGRSTSSVITPSPTISPAPPTTTPGPASSTPAPSTGEPSQPPTTADNGANKQSAATSKLDVGVVDIDTRLDYQSARAAGTGMIVSPSGEVLTNTHVIAGATSISVTVVTTGRSYRATVVGSDATDDVAVLQLQGVPKLDTVVLGDSSTVANGDPVTAVGNAGGVGGIPSVSAGEVTGLNQTINVSDENGGDAQELNNLIETDAALQPGDSGGPLYNAAGQVIGMNTAAEGGRRFRVTGRDSYAIAINTAKSIVGQITAGQASDAVQIGVPGFLGVEVQGSTPGRFGGGAPAAEGAVVTGVLDGTPAAKAGLQAGDVITAVDGQRVGSNDALHERLHGHHPGDKVTITWSDSSGQSHTTSVTLATGPLA